MRTSIGAATVILSFLLGCGEARLQPAPSPKDITEEQKQYLSRLRSEASPGVSQTRAEWELRQRLYRWEEALMREGRPIRTPAKANDFLDLTISAPAQATCGHRLPIKAVVRNLSDQRLALWTWRYSITPEVTSAEGRLVCWRLWLHDSWNQHEVRPPPDQRTITLEPGEQAELPVSDHYDFRILPPGRYHVAATLDVRIEDLAPLGIDAKTWQDGNRAATSNILAVEVVPGREVAGLACSLQIDRSEVKAGEPVALRAALRYVGERDYAYLAKNLTDSPVAYGCFELRDVETGKILSLPPYRGMRPVTDGWTPHVPRASDYAMPRQGESVEVAYRLDAAVWKDHAEFLRPGRTYEVRYRYVNQGFWFLDKGEIKEYSSVWQGWLASDPVRLHVAAE